MNDRRPSRLTVGNIPEPCRLIPAPTRDPLSVGAERHSVDLVEVFEFPTDRCSRFDTPEPCGLVPAPGRDQPTVGAERHRVHILQVPVRQELALESRPGIPEPRRTIPAPGGDNR